MKLHIDDLIYSDFWQKHLIRTNIDGKQLESCPERNWIVFTTNSNFFENNKSLENIQYSRITDGGYHIKVLLQWALKSYNLSSSWKSEILRQFAEVEDKVKKIKNKICESGVIICSSDASVGLHNHSKETKQTITFVYNFLDTKNYDNDSYFKIYENNSLITYLTPSIYPNELISWKNNLPHKVKTNCLSFYWVFDLTEYCNISDVNIDHLKILNW